MPNGKADVLLGEARATSDSIFVLYSLCPGQENRELVAITQHKQRSNWLYIIPKVIKRESSVFQQPITDGLVKSYLNGKREDMIVLRSDALSPSDDAYDNYLPSKTLKLLSNTEKDKVLLEFEVVNKNMFRLDFLHPFSVIQVLAISLIWYNRH